MKRIVILLALFIQGLSTLTNAQEIQFPWNIGTTFIDGESVPIAWSITNPPEHFKVKVDLNIVTGGEYGISTFTARTSDEANGETTFTIRSIRGSGETFKVQVALFYPDAAEWENPIAKAESPLLTVNMPDGGKRSITVLSPTQGEVWEAGETRRITWTTTNIPEDGLMGIGVRPVNRFSEYGSDQVTKSELKNTGEYYWTVPENLRSGEYRIEIWYYISPDGWFGADTEDGGLPVQSFLIKEKESQLVTRLVDDQMQFDMIGGAIGSKYELLSSKDLVNWSRTGRLLTNGTPATIEMSQVPAENSFFKLSSLPPLSATLSHQGELRVGQPIDFVVKASGGESSVYVYHWWISDDENTVDNIIDEGFGSISKVFETPGKKTCTVVIFSGDIVFETSETVTVEIEP